MSAATNAPSLRRSRAPHGQRSMCTVADCAGVVVSVGFCSMHYQRFTKYGDPSIVKVQRSRRAWSRNDLYDLEVMIAQGLSDATIARRLGTTINGIQLARKRHGIKSRTEQLLSATRIAEMLGIGCSKSVSRWIQRGWLGGRRVPGTGRRRWMVTEQQLLLFMEDPAHWQRWHPERITDRDLREWALELRQDERFLTLGEVARRYYVEPSTVAQWIAKGQLPAVRNGNHLVRESDLVGFVRPADYPQTKLARWERRGATWEELPAPEPFRRVRLLRLPEKGDTS